MVILICMQDFDWVFKPFSRYGLLKKIQYVAVLVMVWKDIVYPQTNFQFFWFTSIIVPEKWM